MTFGRPTLYRPEYCERIIELAKEGKSVAEWASDIGVARSSLWEWCQEHEDFSAAFMRAKTEEQAALERLARENFGNKNFNANLWIKSAQARFRDDYTERREIETNGNVSFSGLPSPTITGISFRILDPAKMETDDLEALAEMMQRQQSPTTIDHETLNPNPITESNLND